MESNKFKNQQILLVAHRGLSTKYPENTRIALEAALNRSIDMLEIDIHRTLDDRIVVIHDNTIDRTSNGKGKVSAFTLPTLRQYDFGISKGKAFKGQTIMELDDVLAMVKAATQKLLIELKQPKLYPGIEMEVLNKLESFDMPKEKVIIQSFDQQVIQKIHNLKVGYELGVLISKRKYWYRVPNFKKIGNYAQYINPQFSLVNEAFLKKAKKHGLMVMPYTVNDYEIANRLISLGVDGLISDNPEIFIR
ncbi:glycerophosphodiester phosphodiesterase [Staphylococcus sp. GSSP0090]|nr:glycerophosphodiester phosphodiesterase [Staphylococcus sp. GSSP0090]